MEAIRFGAQTKAFITDPVYGAKSLAGMMDMIRKSEIPDGSNVLYAHLGGQLALECIFEVGGDVVESKNGFEANDSLFGCRCRPAKKCKIRMFNTMPRQPSAHPKLANIQQLSQATP